MPAAFALSIALTLAVKPALTALSAPAHVTVVTDHAHPVSGVRQLRDRGIAVRVLYLDAPRRLLARLNRDLPSDPKAAAAAARKRIHSISVAQVMRAYTALQTALTDRIKHYPAVIFDQRAIVLGVTDLNEALAHYKRWRDDSASGDQR
jgi:integrating conjugative element protein (TIGR03757 family)